MPPVTSAAQTASDPPAGTIENLRRELNRHLSPGPDAPRRPAAGFHAGHAAPRRNASHMFHSGGCEDAS